MTFMSWVRFLHRPTVKRDRYAGQMHSHRSDVKWCACNGNPLAHCVRRC